MGKINILTPNVFNMLAAGEVVQNPASVVKELVENAIDAGATIIDVFIQNGGITKIQVSDNGIGIIPEDMRAAFLPHATSKLKNIIDLDSLSTLGFRGEALASIASVSEVTLISKSKSCETAAKIVLNAGTVIEELPASRNEGTIITVENLFFNTPARLKFLKKASSEQHAILDTIRKIVLANPHISITLESEDGKLISHQSGELIDAIYSVYDAKTAEKLLEIKEPSRNGIRVGGYVSKVDFTRSNRSCQTVIVNGRTVEDATVTAACEKAYAEYLMKRNYPLFVLDIIMPFEDVDSNVHPTKTEVRFRDKQAVFGAVYYAVSQTIKDSLSATAIGFDVSKDTANRKDSNETTANAAKTADINNKPKISVFDEIKNTKTYETTLTKPAKNEFDGAVQTKIDTSALYSLKTQPSMSRRDFSLTSGIKTLKESQIGIYTDEPITTDSSDKINYVKTDYSTKENDNAADSRVFDGKIIGQIFDTYLLVERDERVYIIDQHAAHERILYDRIVEKFSAEYSQPLLIPYKIHPTDDETQYLDKAMPKLISFGFEFEKNGDNYLLKAVPEPLSGLDYNKIFGELFENIVLDDELSLAQLIKDKLCQQACKAAIKGGEPLSREQIERVIRNYVNEDGDLPAKCPHGRPAVIAVSKYDVEKLFKRIV